MSRKKGEGKKKKGTGTPGSRRQCLLCCIPINAPKKHHSPLLSHTSPGGSKGHFPNLVKSLISKVFKLSYDDTILETLDSSEVILCDLCVNRMLTLIHTRKKEESLVVASIQSYASVISDTLLAIVAQSSAQQTAPLVKTSHASVTTSMETVSTNPELEATRMAVKLFLETTLYPEGNSSEIHLVGSESLKRKELNILRASSKLQMEEIMKLLRKSHEDSSKQTTLSEGRQALTRMVLGEIEQEGTGESETEKLDPKLQLEAIVRLEEIHLIKVGFDEGTPPGFSTVAVVKATGPTKRICKENLSTADKETVKDDQTVPTASATPIRKPKPAERNISPNRRLKTEKTNCSPTIRNSKESEDTTLGKTSFLKQIFGRSHFRKEKEDVMEANESDSSKRPRLSPHRKLRADGRCYLRQKKMEEDEKEKPKSAPLKLPFRSPRFRFRNHRQSYFEPREGEENGKPESTSLSPQPPFPSPRGKSPTDGRNCLEEKTGEEEEKESTTSPSNLRLPSPLARCRTDRRRNSRQKDKNDEEKNESDTNHEELQSLSHPGDNQHYLRKKKGDEKNKSECSSSKLPLAFPSSKLRTDGQSHFRQNTPEDEEKNESGSPPVNLPSVPSPRVRSQPESPAILHPKKKKTKSTSRNGNKKTRKGIGTKKKKSIPSETSDQVQDDVSKEAVSEVASLLSKEGDEEKTGETPPLEGDLDQSLMNLANEISQNLNKEKDAGNYGIDNGIDMPPPASVQVEYELITLSDSESSIKSESKKPKTFPLSQEIQSEVTTFSKDSQNKRKSPDEETLAPAKRKQLWTQKYFKYITTVKKIRERNKTCRRHTCEKCDNFYKSAARLRSHKLTHSPDYSIYVCAEAGCLKKFTEERPFIRHKQYHNLAAQRKSKLSKIPGSKKRNQANVLLYPCMFCSLTSRSRSRAEKHMEVSHNERYKRNIHLVRARADELELKHHERLLAMETEPTEGPMEKGIEGGNTPRSPYELPKEVSSAPPPAKFPSSQYIDCPSCLKLFANLDQYVNHFCDYRKTPVFQSFPSGSPAQFPAYGNIWPSTVVSAQGYQISWVPLSQAPSETPSARYTPYLPPPTYNRSPYGVNQFQTHNQGRLTMPQGALTRPQGDGFGSLTSGSHSPLLMTPNPGIPEPSCFNGSETGPPPPPPPKPVNSDFTLQDLIQFEESLDELTAL